MHYGAVASQHDTPRPDCPITGILHARRARQYHIVIAQRATRLEMALIIWGMADGGGEVIWALPHACQLGSLSP